MGDPPEGGVEVVERQPRFSRKNGLRGVRYKARLEPGEAALVREVVAEVKQMLSDRLRSNEQDELATITGIHAGNSEPPNYAPLARLIPDFLPPAGSPRARIGGDATADGGGSSPAGTGGPSGSEGTTGSRGTEDPAEPPAARGPDAAEVERENAAMRMLHEPAILESKLIAAENLLRSIPARGGAVSLSEEQALAWLQALNDVRLVLGEILIRSADAPTRDDFGSNGSPRPGWYRRTVPEEMPDQDSPQFLPWQAYHWCAMMQDDLLQVM